MTVQAGAPMAQGSVRLGPRLGLAANQHVHRRTDLIGPAATEDLTRAQHRSARRLAAEVPDDVAVWPTHGFGSFCSSAKSSGASSSSMGEERRSNLALTLDDEEAFVAHVLDGVGAYPTYYAHMGPINRGGPAPIDLRPPSVMNAAELEAQLDAEAWVVDLAERQAYGAKVRDHVARQR